MAAPGVIDKIIKTVLLPTYIIVNLVIILQQVNDKIWPSASATEHASNNFLRLISTSQFIHNVALAKS